MNEDRVFAGFRTFDAPVDPDPTFGERLFESLAADLGFRAELAPRTLVGRVRRALGVEQPPVGRAALRLAYLFAILGMLVALAIGAAIIANHLTQQLNGDDIVRQSQQLYSNPPAFDLKVRNSAGQNVRYRYDGNGTLRTDFPDGGEFPPGSYRIQTSTQEAVYDAAAGSWSIADLPAPRPPLFSVFPLNWIANKPYLPPEPPPRWECATWQRAEDGMIAGRRAFHVTCGSLGFWIDEETLLLVGSDPQADSSFFGTTATDVSVGVLGDPALFALTQPPGSYDAANPPPSTVLKIGQVAPDWTGQLEGGGTFASASLRGKPAMILFWPTCEPCIGQTLTNFGAVARAHPELQAVSVPWPAENAVAKQQYLDESGGGFAVVRGDDAIAQAWGIQISPTLVLLDQGGQVAGVVGGMLTADDDEAMVAALEAGQPIPTPVPSGPSPSPTPVPEPTVLTSPQSSGVKASTTLAVGDPLPGIDGVLEDKSGDFGSSTLIGKPAVILVFSGACPSCAGALDELGARYAAHHDRTSFVAILWGSTYPALDEAMIGGGYKHAVTFENGLLATGFPVVWDDCACVSSQLLGLDSVPAFLFVDDAGKFAGFHLGPIAGDELDRDLDALEKGSPLP